MKKLFMILPLVLVLCFAFGCQDKEATAELEEFKAQAALEEQNKELVLSWIDLPPKYRSRSYVRISQGRKEKKWAGSATQQNRSSACFGRLKSFRAKV